MLTLKGFVKQKFKKKKQLAHTVFLAAAGFFFIREETSTEIKGQ